MPPRKKKKLHGEDCLSALDALTLTLENGTTVAFDIAAETSIASDDVGLASDATRSAARYSFWAYQAEMMLLAVKECERDTAEFEAYSYHAYRKEQMNSNGLIPTESYLRAMMDADSKVRTKREKLAEIRYDYAIVRALRDAMAKRHEILRTLTMRLRPTRTL